MPARNEIIDELGFGFVPNLFAEADSAPNVQNALWNAFREIMLRGVLPRTLKEMMAIVVSRVNGSTYARSVHLHALMVQGVEAEVLGALGRGTPPEGVSTRTIALLHFAEAASLRPSDPASVAGLEAAGFDEVEVREAVAVVGLFRMINAWTDLLAIPVDDLGGTEGS